MCFFWNGIPHFYNMQTRNVREENVKWYCCRVITKQQTSTQRQTTTNLYFGNSIFKKIAKKIFFKCGLDQNHSVDEKKNYVDIFLHSFLKYGIADIFEQLFRSNAKQFNNFYLYRTIKLLTFLLFEVLRQYSNKE